MKKFLSSDVFIAICGIVVFLIICAMGNLWLGAFIIICIFGGVIVGAYIHHRGVSIGSGSKETFTGRVPDGEVFRLGGADDLPEEPEKDMLDVYDKTTAARMDRFLSTIMGKA